ncbi:MAG: cell division protein FtsZ [Bacteroidetes bacterium]|nr:MAG: cell division protein FtsZ [Bacteroidota bacterium]
MIHFDLPKEKSSIIKVIGVGGGGGNAVNHMHSQVIEGCNFIICNTDAQALANSAIPNRIQLGPHLTQGLGAGANPEIGRQATEESLEEIKRILEVNTKMAFITAGMGGGTGTGGAPIIAKICKDLGILTVGIVTTPFAYEGKKRQLQAEEGIKILKGYVDTLLVISNDKLRHQYGNLKMRDAFAKADNVLATAAKCITDVISSTGQINVDFADVCTVMKNGGVAILGNSAVAGENRAQQAIEEALNSPLLNDNEIKGAKWILMNINSSEGEHEFTMDEVEVIQNYVLAQAGEDSDVILGLGYDNTLGDQLGITIIATGFQHKDPFTKPVEKKKPSEEKIIMVLGEEEKPKVSSQESGVRSQEPGAKNPVSSIQHPESITPEHLAPVMIETPASEEPISAMMVIDEDELEEEEMDIDSYQEKKEESSTVIHWELDMKADSNTTNNTSSNITKEDKKEVVKEQSIITNTIVSAEQPKINEAAIPENNQPVKNIFEISAPVSAASGGYLARPANIYAESKPGEITPITSAEKPHSHIPPQKEEEVLPDLQLVMRDDIPAADAPLAHHSHTPMPTISEDQAMPDEEEEQQRRAAERLQKLRNLSFNFNAADPNNEFETVPAYIRRNMELYNQSSVAENFYSNIEVKKDGDSKATLSTINTFLDGKKPD